MRKRQRRPRFRAPLGLKRTLESCVRRPLVMMNHKWGRVTAAAAFGVAILAITPFLRAQQEFFTAQDVIKYTPDWKGERFPDGRPKVPDEILDRMKNVTLEEAWATLQQAGFMHQYEDGWLSAAALASAGASLPYDPWLA